MITTSEINSVNQMQVTTEQSSKNVFGKEDFLNLLVTQLKNQDPLNPLDSADFTAQLAQFSSLEQLYNINSGIEKLSTLQTNANNLQAISTIGKKVNSLGNTLNLIQGKEVSFSFDLENNADKLYIYVSDNNGNLIKKIEKGLTESGTINMTWDGLNEEGIKVADGLYTYNVSAYDQNNNLINYTPYIENEITGVVYNNNESYLNSGNLNIPFSNTIKIFN